MERIETLNITLKVEINQVAALQRYLDEHLNVISFRVLPSTEKMYNEDKTFKTLVKAKKQIDKKIGEYINDNNQKYLLK